MTTAPSAKICIDCGAEFARSPSDATVRCPACRGKRRASKRSASFRAEQRSVETCYCGKTVIATRERGVRIPTGVTCPRDCSPTPTV